MSTSQAKSNEENGQDEKSNAESTSAESQQQASASNLNPAELQSYQQIASIVSSNQE
jgi:hypothetical protein